MQKIYIRVLGALNIIFYDKKIFLTIISKLCYKIPDSSNLEEDIYVKGKY